MSLAQQSRDHLLAARVALFEADLALACDDPRRARIQLDLAQAHTVECRKLMLLPAAREIPTTALTGQPDIDRHLE